jgi:hypothetical protein
MGVRLVDHDRYSVSEDDVKGLQYTSIDDERLPPGLVQGWRRRAAPEEVRQAWVDAFNAQWEIVGECSVDGCGYPLIRGERTAHMINHAPARLRPILRQATEITDAELAAALPALLTDVLRSRDAEAQRGPRP